MRVFSLVAVLLLRGAGAAACSSPSVLLEVANAPIVRSSHSAAAALVLRYLNLTDNGRPLVAVQADIEGATYFCSCKQDLHYWPIASGLKKWAGANGRSITVDPSTTLRASEKCLRSTDPKEQASFEEVRREIDAKRPVIATLSFDPESSRSLETSLLSQQRISAVVVGYRKEGKQLVVLFPEGIDRDKHYSQLINLSQLSNQPTSKLCQLAWDSNVPNIIFTFIRSARGDP